MLSIDFCFLLTYSRCLLAMKSFCSIRAGHNRSTSWCVCVGGGRGGGCAQMPADLLAGVDPSATANNDTDNFNANNDDAPPALDLDARCGPRRVAPMTDNNDDHDECHATTLHDDRRPRRRRPRRQSTCNDASQNVHDPLRPRLATTLTHTTTTTPRTTPRRLHR